MKEDSGGDKVRTRIQESIDQAEREHKREVFRRRLELARQGVVAYDKKRFQEAVKAFRTYIKILEEAKGCGEGGLLPSHFELTTEIPELLLISGVYWDLAKLYDRTTSAERLKDFHLYLEKYVLFSKGMPYEPVAGETLRKYIATDKPLHRDEFRNAYKTLSGGGSCFVATALLDVTDVRTIGRLRGFRDRVLLRSTLGRRSVAWYYRNGPRLAVLTDRLPPVARRSMGKCLDLLARVLEKGTDSNRPN